MHHMAGILDNDMTPVCNRLEAFLFVGAFGLMALFAFDCKRRTFYAAQELNSLFRVERLRRGGAMQRIEFPNPFAIGVLPHSSLGHLESKLVFQPRVSLL